MKEMLKTLLNGVKTWVKGLIKESTADWNQNDSSADNHIKNRPFYEEKTTKNTVVLPETTVEITDEYIAIAGTDDGFDFDLIFIEDEKYTVTFNGTTYECVAWYNNDACWLIGNGSIYGGEGMGEDVPFSFDSYDDGSCYLNVPEEGTYTVSIVHNEERTVVHKLDAKYIPDGKSSQPDWNQNDETQPDYIKNKPFSCERNVVYEEVLTPDEDGMYYIPDYYPDTRITYEVLINGKGYSTTYDYYDPDFILRLNQPYNIPIIGYQDLSKLGVSGECTLTIAELRNVTPIPRRYIDLTPQDIDALSAENPCCRGEFSMNREEGSVVGENSIAMGLNTVAEHKNQFTIGKNNLYTTGDEFVEIIEDVSIRKYNSTDIVYGDDYTYDENTGKFKILSPQSTTFNSFFSGNKYFLVSRSNGQSQMFYIGESPIKEVNGNYVTFSKLRQYTTKKVYEGEKYAFVVGNGEYAHTRSNAHTLDWNGNAEYAGDVKANACGGAEPISLVETWNKLKEVDEKASGGASIEVDSELSTTSENPVQNKVVTTEIEAVQKDVDNLNELVEQGYYNEVVNDLTVELTFSDAEQHNTGTFPRVYNPLLEVGKDYIVTWNGVEYKCTSRQLGFSELQAFVLGNVGGTDFGKELGLIETSEPFAILFNIGYPDLYGTVHAFDGSTSATLSIVASKKTTIKNKYLDIFDEVNEKVILQDFEGELIGDEFVPINQTLNLEGGKNYIVNWKGTDYECICQEFNSDGVHAYLLGNIGMATGGDNTGEPFLIMEVPNEASMVMPIDGTTSVKMSIAQVDVLKIKEELLPELGGSGGTWKIIHDETLTEDVASLSFDGLDCYDLRLGVFGRWNDSTNSLSNSNLSANILVNEAGVGYQYSGHFGYIRSSGEGYCTILDVKSALVSPVIDCRIMGQSGTQTYKATELALMTSNRGRWITEKISTIMIIPSVSDVMLKAGCRIVVMTRN